MERVHVATYVNFATRENQVVGVFDELMPAIEAARQFYLDTCKRLQVEPIAGSSCTMIVPDKECNPIGFVEVNNLTLHSEYFPVISMTRDDLKNKGFDADNLNDDTMSVIASQAADWVLDGGDYWSCIEESALSHGIPRKED